MMPINDVDYLSEVQPKADLTNLSWLTSNWKSFYLMLTVPTKADPFWMRVLQFSWNHKTHPNEEIGEIAKSQSL